MKTVVIFCRNIAADQAPFNDPYYWNGYQDLLLAVKARGAKAYFATGNDTYKGGGVFSEAFTVDNKQPVEKFQRVADVKADVVYEKGGFEGRDVLVLNPPFVHDITSSKIETNKHFGKYQPLTIVCQTRAQVEAAFEKIPGDMIVVKEPEGNGGKYVQIGKKADILPTASTNYPVVVQQFVDTSGGVKGLVEGIHDLRIKMGGGKVWGGKFRIAAPGEMRANVSQGASEKFLYPDEIPAEAVKLAKEIDPFFKDYPRYYALDFALTSDGWKLIELNAKPGLEPADLDERSKFVVDQLAAYLIEICQ